MKYKVIYHGGEIGDSWEDETQLDSLQEAFSFCNTLLAKNQVFVNDVQLPYTILSIQLVDNVEHTHPTDKNTIPPNQRASELPLDTAACPTPETEAMLLRIDDSEIDLSIVRSEMGDMEIARNRAEDALRRILSGREHGQDVAESYFELKEKTW